MVEVTNKRHENPAAHQYVVSIDDVTNELMACTCPHHVHRRMNSRVAILTDTFVVVFELRKHLREERDFCIAITELEFQTEPPEDGYPEWHPTPYPFHGMLKLFLYLEVTGDRYQSLVRHSELVGVFRIGRIPDKSNFLETWRNRFDDDVRGCISQCTLLGQRDT